MREIDTEQLATALDEGAVLVDVREPGEYADGHVPGAINIPMDRLPAAASDLDRDQPVYVVCASGNRSAAMTDVLTDAGFAATNIAGGTKAWIQAGRPVERS